MRKKLEKVVDLQIPISILSKLQAELVDSNAPKSTLVALSVAIKTMAEAAEKIADDCIDNHGCKKVTTERCGGFDILKDDETYFDNISIGLVRLIARSPWATAERRKPYITCYDRSQDEYFNITSYR